MEAITFILKLLDLADLGMLTVERIQVLRAQVEQMRADGRDPTADEWADLFKRIDDASSRLDAADKKLNP